MSAASQIYYKEFDAVFFKLSSELRQRIQAKIDAVGSNISAFAHHRLKGLNRYRLRVGNYRIIYTFEPEENTIHLLALGHRREIYRA